MIVIDSIKAHKENDPAVTAYKLADDTYIGNANRFINSTDLLHRGTKANRH